MARQTVYVTPAGASREEKRAARKMLRALALEERPDPVDPKDLQLPAAAVPGILGPGFGNGGYWNIGAPGARVPAHEATSKHLAGMYLAVADGGSGHSGPVLALDLNADGLFQFTPWDAYNDSSARGAFSTNIVVLGAYRAGKSGTIKTLVYRSIAFGHQAIVPSDSKGEWVALAEHVGGTVIRLGAGREVRLNPLDRGPRRSGVSDEQDEKMVEQRRRTTLQSLVETAHGNPIGAEENAALGLALDRAIAATDDNPTLREVHTQLGLIRGGAVSETETELIAAARTPWWELERFVSGDLSGLFEDASTVSFDEDSPLVVVDTSELFARSDLVAQLTQVCTTAWVQAVLSDKNSGRTRYLIREEGWRDMTNIRALMMFQQWLKLSRDYGIANIVLLHKMGDLDAVGEAGSRERSLAYSIINDIENKFLFRVNQQGKKALEERLDLPPSHVELIATLGRGEFVAYVGQFSYVLDCFSTSTETERQLFDTDSAMNVGEVDEFMVDELELDQLWPVSEVLT
ncbi:hypothetical protein ACFC14_18800 [Microbacterium sp. NPDC055988]|uniref:hypothetical protein n=1 Tax=Microbacterium sp. NPDC055988 TaxID=3345671 RepID=UPI0035DFC404